MWQIHRRLCSRTLRGAEALERRAARRKIRAAGCSTYTAPSRCTLRYLPLDSAASQTSSALAIETSGSHADGANAAWHGGLAGHRWARAGSRRSGESSDNARAEAVIAALDAVDGGAGTPDTAVGLRLDHGSPARPIPGSAARTRRGPRARSAMRGTGHARSVRDLVDQRAARACPMTAAGRYYGAAAPRLRRALRSRRRKPYESPGWRRACGASSPGLMTLKIDGEALLWWLFCSPAHHSPVRRASGEPGFAVAASAVISAATRIRERGGNARIDLAVVDARACSLADGPVSLMFVRDARAVHDHRDHGAVLP